MRFLTYNILDGGGQRLDRLVTAITELDPDLAVLCELNGWQSLPSPFASEFHLGINSSGVSPYHVGILSKERPLEIIPLCEDLNHGALLAHFPGVSVLGTHLHPALEAIRVREAKAILRALDGISGPLVLAGDLNSCWPDESGLEGRSGALELFHDAGFMDPCRGDSSEHTLRTALSPADPLWRFDYLLARNLEWKEVHALHDERYTNLSDHWPVLGTATL